jgi:hypothetical protein
LTRQTAAKASPLTLSGEIKLGAGRAGASAAGQPTERRVKPRIQRPFPAMVEGVDAEGQPFELKTELQNMSSGGLYLRMTRRVNVGEDLKFTISFVNGGQSGATAFVFGRVLRVEPGIDGLNGTAMAIQYYEFL